MTDMQKTIKTLLKEGTGAKAVLLYIFAAVITLTQLIMYYASGLTLNTLFAGIGSMYVSLIALACALGAIAGIFLFTLIRNGIRSETEERCQEILEEALNKAEKEQGSGTMDMDDQSETDPDPLSEDAVHFQMKGILESRILLIQDIIRIIAVVFLDVRCGLVLLAGVALYDFLFRHMAEKKIVSVKKFIRDLDLIPSVILSVFISADLIFALYEMKSGRMGLYGVIMMLAICMDLIRAHMEQAHEILGPRKDLRSIEILDQYCADSSSMPVYPQTKAYNAEKKAYPAMAVSFLALTLSAVLYVHGICGILAYRTPVSLHAVAVLMPLMSVFASLCHVYWAAGCAGKKADVFMRKAASACVSVLTLFYGLKVNPLLAGILGSALAAEQILIPLILQNRDRTENETSDHIWGPVHFICITMIIGAGVLLYWNARASFADVLMIFVLYMVTYMHADRSVSGARKEEDEDEQ